MKKWLFPPFFSKAFKGKGIFYYYEKRYHNMRTLLLHRWWRNVVLPRKQRHADQLTTAKPMPFSFKKTIYKEKKL